MGKKSPLCTTGFAHGNARFHGFSPTEPVHGQNLRTPESLLYENWKGVEPSECLRTEYVFDLINRMKRYQDLELKTVRKTYDVRKSWGDIAISEKFIE